MFEIFYDLFKEGSNDTQMVPAQYLRIVQNTLDLKNDIEFGYAFNRHQASYGELLGSRAYQRAINKVNAEENERKREQNEQSS